MRPPAPKSALAFALASVTAMLGGCAAVPRTAPPGAPPPRPVLQVPPQDPAAPITGGFRAPAIQNLAGLDWLYRRDIRSLAGVLGNPRLDVVEGDTRKLQFAGEPCVLDVYLYPLAPNGEPVATHVEARRASDGEEVDRRACAEALRRR